MNTGELIVDLAIRDITIRLEDGRLIASPAARLTDEDIRRIRDAKPALVALLERRAAHRPRRSACIDCGAPLESGQMARCRSCVAAAYRTAGRSPP